MAWDGTDRRQGGCNGKCDVVQETGTIIAVMQTKMDNLIVSVDKIEKHMEAASTVRMGWWMALAGIVLSILIQTSIFVFFLGQMCKQIDVNSGRLVRIENVIFKGQL